MSPASLVPPDPAVVADDVARALAEDLGSGDVTAALLPDTTDDAYLLCKEGAVVCGRPWFDATLRALDPDVAILWRAGEGERVAAGTVLATLRGRSRALVSAERTALNFMQTLSGTATTTAAHVEARSATIESARVLMTQHEVPDAASMAAMRIARSAGLLCLHNPAPPREGDIRPLLRLADVLTPNESELALLLKSRGGELAAIGRPGALDDATLHALCRQIEVPTVVLTLGARGVFVSHRDDTLRGDAAAHYRVAAETVKPVRVTKSDAPPIEYP